MIDKQQLRRYIIEPHLRQLGLYSVELEELLMGTCAIESRLGTYVHQMGNGPALGIFQMEPITYKDIVSIVVPVVPQQVRIALRNHYGFDTFRTPPPERMIHDLGFATVMAALHYWRFRNKQRLPSKHDTVGQAQYWKRFYNSSLGAGTATEYVRMYNLLVR